MQPRVSNTRRQPPTSQNDSLVGFCSPHTGPHATPTTNESKWLIGGFFTPPHMQRWWAPSHPAPVLLLFTLLRACIQTLPTTTNARAAGSGYKHGWLNPAHVPYAAKNMCWLTPTRPSEGAGHVICPASNIGRFSISAWAVTNRGQLFSQPATTF